MGIVGFPFLGIVRIPDMLFCFLLIPQGFETNMKTACLLLPSVLFGSVFILPVAFAQSLPSLCTPGISSNPLVMENLCADLPPAKVVPAVARSKALQPNPLLTLAAERLSQIILVDPPTIAPGDVMVFEANRRDFILRTELSNGKEIVVGPMNLKEAEDTSVAWRKGHVRLDYPEVLGQKVIRYHVQTLHQTGPPLLFRGVRIYRAGTMMLELEKASPSPEQKSHPQFEPPSHYPPDPVLVASLNHLGLPLREPAPAPAGFIRNTLPSMQPIVQSTTTTPADANHFKWNGKEFDSESGLLNFGARYYSPALGRFMTPDPKIISRQRMFDPQQWNMYSYGRNNPTSFFDPDGKETKTATTGAAYDQLVKALAKAYVRTDFQQKFNQLKSSSMTFNINKADLKSVDKPGEQTLGTAKINPTKDPNGKVDKASSSVDIKLDLDRAQGQLGGTTVPAREEIFHGAQADNNPDMFLSAQSGDKAAHDSLEEDAHNFAKDYYDVSPDKKTGLSPDEAEQQIRKMMPPPATPKPDKKDPQ